MHNPPRSAAAATCPLRSRPCRPRTGNLKGNTTVTASTATLARWIFSLFPFLTRMLTGPRRRRNLSPTRHSTSLTASRSATITTTRRTTLYALRRAVDGLSRAPARCHTRATGITPSTSPAIMKTKRAGRDATNASLITGRSRGACSATDTCEWSNRT